MKTRGRPQPIDAQVGRRIKERRLILKMSQNDLGRAAGISFQQIQKYEKGKNRLSAGRLVQFAEILDVELSYFFKFNEREKLKPRVSGLPPHVVEFLELPQARRLMRAFVRIRERSVRDTITKLVVKLSAVNAAGFKQSPAAPRRRSGPSDVEFRRGTLRPSRDAQSTSLSLSSPVS